jgi:lipopolysaccharide/colanic/teichoic acid biosynthesis glycosyltransferase
VSIKSEASAPLEWVGAIQYRLGGDSPPVDKHSSETRSRSWLSRRSRRVLDAALAAVGLVLFSGPLLVLGGLVRLTSRGPVLYRARRVGQYGREFEMYKFRSMVVDADRQGPLVTVAGDRRITPLGRWLRRTKLDELPALWNVVRGEMALVGPRPENPDAVRLYTEDQRRVLSVRPGLTSWATLKYRHEEDILASYSDLEQGYFVVMQDKLRLDLDYLDRASLLTDVQILVRTAAALRPSQSRHA